MHSKLIGAMTKVDFRRGLGRAVPLALGLLAGVGIWIFSSSVFRDWVKAVSHPAPLIYTEGVMAWASGEIEKGQSPYGKIDQIPSKYFCYGPLMPILAAAAGSDGKGHIKTGRVLAGISLLIASLLCVFLCRALGGGWSGGAAAGGFFFAAVFSSNHAWSFRVDTMVVAIGLASALAGILYTKKGGWFYLVMAGALGVIAGCTKFTSCFWAAWTILLSGGIGLLSWQTFKENPQTLRRHFAGPCLYGLGWLAGLAIMELGFPGALGDQVLNQAGSGLNPWGYSRNTVLIAATIGATPFLLAGISGVISGHFRPLIVALSAGALSSAMLIKFGSDINYFFDCFALLGIAAGVGAGRLFKPWGGVVAGACAAWVLFWSCVPVPSNMPHRLAAEDGGREIVVSRETSYLFRGIPYLCEDPFFPSYHGGEVLASDPFQASLDKGFQEAARKVGSKSGRLVAGERLGRALGPAIWNRFTGVKWLQAAGLPGAGIYLPSAEVENLHRRFPDLKFQITPSEVRFYAAAGETIDWSGVAEVSAQMGVNRKPRFFSETLNPLDYFVLTGGAGFGGWR
jgi:hypothetical protein